jgi:hypothetical protein
MIWLGNKVTTLPAREIDPKTAIQAAQLSA